MAVAWPCSHMANLWQRQLIPKKDFANAEKVASAADFIFKSIHDKVRGRMNWLVGGCSFLYWLVIAG